MDESAPIEKTNVVKGMLREPLLHFMLVGAALFLAFEWAGNDDDAPDNEIRVDRAALMRFLTYRDPRLNVDSARTVLTNMTDAQRDTLTEEYVRDEVLFRQARAIGLDPYDYTGRRRLIAQLDYINRGFIEATLTVSDEELREFFLANSERYLVPPKITFTHVYFSSDTHGENAKAVALFRLGELNNDRVPFHAGPSWGDVFLYHRNYVAREAEEIASHFGGAFAEAIFGQAPSELWTGPIESTYGYHVVMVSSRKPGYSPPLEEVRQRVLEDLSVERMRIELDAYYRQARSAYDIVIEPPAAAP